MISVRSDVIVPILPPCAANGDSRVVHAANSEDEPLVEGLAGDVGAPASNSRDATGGARIFTQRKTQEWSDTKAIRDGEI